MNGIRYFADSNVLLCPYDEPSPIRGDHSKLRLAWLWENRRGAVSWQVLITLVERVWHWTGQKQIPVWCGLIAAAAERTIGAITILDPFKTSPPVS